jgi:hypothetical protein
MTSPNRFTSKTSASLAMALTILAIGAPSSMLAGCEKKKPPPVVEVAPPPPPPIPDPVAVEPIMTAMAPSAKVQYPQSAAPHSEGLAKAVIAFADALAKGDVEKFGAMLSPAAKPLLDQLTADGAWEETTKKIEAVRIVLTEDNKEVNAVSAAVYFAVQAPEGAYVLGWGAIKVGDNWTFAGAAATSLTKRRAQEWDSVGMAALMSDNAPEAPPTIADVPAEAAPSLPPTDGSTPPAETPPTPPAPTGG